MLVIRRRAGQSIRIGDEVEIHIAEISPSKVTIGIRAPREVSVTRSEVTLTKEQNLRAADSVTADALAKLARGARTKFFSRMEASAPI
jgi:carbon storage regulator